MIDARGRSDTRMRGRDFVTAGSVIAHDATPAWLLGVLRSPLRAPVAVGLTSAVFGTALVLVACVHLAIRFAPSFVVPLLTVSLALLPTVRLAFGSRPPLVSSIAAVSPLLRTLDLEGVVRGCRALAAAVPLSLGAGLVAAAAAASLWTAGDRAGATGVLVAFVLGTGAVGLLAAARGGRAVIERLGARAAVVLGTGTIGLALTSWLAPHGVPVVVETLASDARLSAATPAVVVGVAIAPALWLASDLLVRDAGALLRFVRELVSCGAAVGALVAAGSAALLVGAAVAWPAAAAVARIAGAAESAWLAGASAWQVVAAAATAVVLEPLREHLVTRAAVFVVLVLPIALVLSSGVPAIWLLPMGLGTVAVAAAVMFGRLR